MAKTVFVDNTWLTPSKMNSYWGIDGTTGHVHDGTDTDGSLPKVQLSNALECQGVLPGANIQAPLPTANIDHQHGADSLAVVAIATDTDWDSFIGYITGSMVVHLDSIDPTLHPEDATWSYSKIGNICHLEWPSSYGVDATNNEFKVSPGSGGGGTWPAAVVPTNEQFAGAGMVSAIWTGHGDSQFRPGLLMIDNGSGDQWDFYTTDETTGEWAVDGFGTTDNPGLKGLLPGGCSYITD